MANLITHALTYTREQIQEYFLQPLFVDGKLKGQMNVRTGIKSGDKLDKISNLSKITKAYQQGASFTPSTGVTLTQKTITMADMKAEVEQNGRAFYNSIKQELLKSGVEANDLEGTALFDIILDLFGKGVAADLERQAWLGWTAKETLSAGVPTATADADYNQYTGVLPLVVSDILTATIPAAQKISTASTTYYDTAPVAPVDTVTLTGTSGTANITFNGTAYLVTWDGSSLAGTASDFVTSHAATILGRMDAVTVTSSGADVIFTNPFPGAGQTVTIANVSGDLDGSVAATTAEVAAVGLKSDSAKTMFKNMYSAMPSAMRAMKQSLQFHVDSELYDNYAESLEGTNTESTYRNIVDGVERLVYRGIPIIEHPEWNDHTDSDWGDRLPNFALLTMPENLILGVDGESDDLNVEMFYDKTNQKNVVRAEYKAGIQYLHAEYIVAAYA